MKNRRDDLVVDLYDFDRTIYPADCSVDFWIYCMKKQPSLITTIPRSVYCAALYALRADTSHMKSLFFSFLTKIDPIPMAEEFWEVHHDKVADWIKPENRDGTPVVVASASPEFLLKPICEKLQVHHLIATDMDIKTGEVLGINCKGKEKVRRINKELPGITVRDVYTDSLKSDWPILELGKSKFLVKNSKVTLLEEI